MNQKNIFTGIAAVLVLQSIAFYTMAGKFVADSFPDLVEQTSRAPTTLMKVCAMFCLALGLITYSVRNYAQVLWAYTIGIGLLSLNTLKDLFIDKLNVPMPAVVIQVGMTLLCAYLWSQQKQIKPA